ncbi:MAG TPA: hypothetical protein VEJ63_07360 [Planctomycetota bacterium]|nr:hypothetical protein [Planctomycetota bacterium]
MRLNLSRKHQKYLLQRAKKKDCTPDAFVEELLDRDAQDEYIESLGGPASLTPKSREDLERMLLEGMQSPRSRMTKTDWDELHAYAGSLRRTKSNTRERRCSAVPKTLTVLEQLLQEADASGYLPFGQKDVDAIKRRLRARSRKNKGA